MGDVTEDDIEVKIRRAVAKHDSKLLQEVAFQLGTISTYAGHFPERSFDLLLSLMNQQDFLELEGSSHVLNLFDYEWDELSDSQKERLLPVLERSFATFLDRMSQFKISVLIGEYYNNQQALQVLHRLRTVQDDEQRLDVAHGLQHMAESSHDAGLSRAAYKELLQMRSDPSEYVRNGVERFLGELATSSEDSMHSGGARE